MLAATKPKTRVCRDKNDTCGSSRQLLSASSFSEETVWTAPVLRRNCRCKQIDYITVQSIHASSFSSSYQPCQQQQHRHPLHLTMCASSSSEATVLITPGLDEELAVQIVRSTTTVHNKHATMSPSSFHHVCLDFR